MIIQSCIQELSINQNQINQNALVNLSKQTAQCIMGVGHY